MWTHLSRIRGGIGLRGPGETQLETDRRVIRRKISMLKKRLKDVAEHRANLRQGRRQVPTAALVGYTNAGKSSLLKALSGADVFIEDRLFATLDTLAREVDVAEGYRFRVTDTVGFIRKLPHHLVASFRATIEEAQEADLILHVIDASEANWEEHAEVVEREVGSMGPRRGDSASGANERRCYAPRADRGSAPRPPASGGRGGCARVKYLFPLMCVLAACGDSTSIPPTPPPPAPGTPILQAVGTFFRPTYLTAPVSASTRLFVTERGGAIRIVRNDTILPTPFLDLRGKIDSAVESGLFSMAFHPQYATNHKFFVFFTN